jgi:hypothetical protein
MNPQSQLMTNQVNVVARYPPNSNDLPSYTYVGTQGADEALKLLKSRELPDGPWGMVFNTDPIKDPGQHWIALYVPNGDSTTIELMDSYGSDTLTTYGPDVQELLKHVNINPAMPRLQGDKTYVCGHYCLAYLYARTHGKTPVQFTQPFLGATKTNDRKVCQFVCKIMVRPDMRKEFDDKIGPLGQPCQGNCCTN